MRYRRHSYLAGYWVSGFTTAAALRNAVEGEWVWVIVLLVFSLANFLVARSNHNARLGRVMSFNSYAELRDYIDTLEKPCK